MRNGSGSSRRGSKRASRSGSSRRRSAGRATSRAARPRRAAAGRSGAARKTARRSAAKGSRRYGPRASADVEQAMHELKHGQLRSGRSGRKVRNPKQAIAIGLSKARHEGAKVPPAPRRAAGRSRRG